MRIAFAVALERLKLLAGEWEGTAKGPGGEKGNPTTATFRVLDGGKTATMALELTRKK
jgi:hypothetical protein